MSSCHRNHCAAVGALLAAGANVFRASAEGASAITVCCKIGRPEILDMLLARCERTDGRAILQEQLAGSGALFVAMEHDHSSCTRVLLKYGANTEANAPDFDHLVPGA